MESKPSSPLYISEKLFQTARSVMSGIIFILSIATCTGMVPISPTPGALDLR